MEMAEYRTELHMRAEAELRSKVGLHVWPLPAVIGELLALKPEAMTIDDHRLKGFYLTNKKTMREYEAWELAQEQLVKLKKRSRFIYPVFGKEQLKKISAYQPKNKLVGKGTFQSW